MDPLPVHVAQSQGDVDEDQDELRDAVAGDLIKGSAVDVLHQEVNAGDLESGPLDLAVMDLEQALVIGPAGDLEFMDCLVNIDIIIGISPLDVLQGVLRTELGVLNQEDRAARARARGIGDSVIHLARRDETRGPSTL